MPSRKTARLLILSCLIASSCGQKQVFGRAPDPMPPMPSGIKEQLCRPSAWDGNRCLEFKWTGSTQEGAWLRDYVVQQDKLRCMKDPTEKICKKQGK